MAKKNEIAKAESASLQPLENIENLIHVIRGKQVMLDRDLARLYGVETRVLNQAVQRNIERFPKDFMFQLSKEDVEFLKSQNVILETGTNMSSQNVTTSDEFLRSQIVTLEKVDMRGKHVKFLPYAFTENGVANRLRSIPRCFCRRSRLISLNTTHSTHLLILCRSTVRTTGSCASMIPFTILARPLKILARNGSPSV